MSERVPSAPVSKGQPWWIWALVIMAMVTMAGWGVLVVYLKGAIEPVPVVPDQPGVEEAALFLQPQELVDAGIWAQLPAEPLPPKLTAKGGATPHMLAVLHGAEGDPIIIQTATFSATFGWVIKKSFQLSMRAAFVKDGYKPKDLDNGAIVFQRADRGDIYFCDLVEGGRHLGVEIMLKRGEPQWPDQAKLQAAMQKVQARLKAYSQAHPATPKPFHF